MKTNKALIIFTVLIVAMLGIVSNATAQQQVNVKTLFRLLPADAFPSYLPTGNPAAMESHIDVCDYKSGYLNLGQIRDKWEMCHWNLKNGNKLIAVNYGISPSFYLYANGKISKTDGFGTNELNIEPTQGQQLDYVVQYYIPRYGTSIIANANGQQTVVFKWVNEKFVRLTDYPAKNSTHQQLFKGFAAALNTSDADKALQYILPYYVTEQCMGVFNGNKEQFLCELISGDDEKGFVKPQKFSDIKKVTYRYTPDDGFANHTLFIELKNGRSYTAYPSIENLEIYEQTMEGDGKLMETIPYIMGEAG